MKHILTLLLWSGFWFVQPALAGEVPWAERNLAIGAVAEMSEHKQQMVAWCWAINGFFSVVASILSTMLGMAYGFRIVVLIGTLIYAAGIFAMTRILGAKVTA